MPDFAQRLPIPQFRVAPSIDPLATRTNHWNAHYVDNVLEKYHIDPGRPGAYTSIAL